MVSSSNANLISTNAGVTWTRARFMAGNIETDGNGGHRFLNHSGKVLVGQSSGGISSVLLPDGTCARGAAAEAALGGRKMKGLSVYQGDGRTYQMAAGSPGSVYTMASSGTQVVIQAAGASGAAGVGLYSSATGDSWTPLNLPRGSQLTFSSLAFSGNTLWANAGGTLFKADSANLNPVPLPSPVTSIMMAAAEESLYVLTEKGLFVSSDLGLTFPALRIFGSPVCGSSFLSASQSFESTSDGTDFYFLRDHQSFVRTTDGGKTLALYIPSTPHLFRPMRSSPQHQEF
jgi:hypothetical protein